jgi:putative peptide zinc metalloprotease protein
MVDSLFSESWYRVADLKPRLRGHVQIHRHNYRGKDWYVIQDHSTGRFHRFSQEAYLIIGLMDGKRTLDEIWEAACASLGDDMPTQEEVIRLLSQLHSSDVLQTDMPPDIADLHRRYEREKRMLLFSRLASPFAIRIPLFDPERFLSATQALVRPLYGWVSLLVWGGVLVTALILAGIHWEELTSNLSDRVLALENLFLLWLIYPVVKALHELAHAYTVKHWGGEVHEMGVMFLVFVPIPYVDASSSSAFWERYKRVLVGGAGIVMEIFLAALAMLIWAMVEPGPVRSLAFNVIIVGGISTLLFNGNPLLRFDAYYMLSDLLEIPNLASRATRFLGFLYQKYLIGLKEVQSPATSPGEAPWLAFYAVASFVYRLFITVRIAMFVASKFFVFGVVLAGWGLFSMLVMPLYRVLRFAFTDPAMQSQRMRIVAVVGILVGVILLSILAVPLPSYTVAEGVIWAPENSQVHVRANGFVKKVIATPGQVVSQGDPLVLCENPELAAEVEVLEAQLREFESRHRLSVTRDRTEAEILMDEIGRVRAELERKRTEAEDLVMRSPADGTFLVLNPTDLPGRYMRRGVPLGYVVDFSKVTARVVVPQRDVDLVRTEARRVSVRISEAIGREIPAHIGREVPAASHDLPSFALSLEGGGSVALDPREKEEPKAFEKLFQFEILIPDLNLRTIGERVFVRFTHDPQPLAFRWYRAIRRTLLSKFSV